MKNNLVFRENDLSAFEYKKLRKDAGWKDLDDNQIEKSINNSDYIVTVREEESIIAMARTISDGAYMTYIFDVVVSSEYRGCGIGKTMIEQIIEYYKNTTKDMMQIVLVAVSAEVEGFYKKIGFKKYPNLISGAGMGMWINGKPY